MRLFNRTHIAMMAVLGLALTLDGCGASPSDISDTHSALSGTCVSTGNNPGDINYCPISCPAPYLPFQKQYCDPATGSWTLCTCVIPAVTAPDGGAGTDGRECTIGGTAGGQLGWQYQLSPGVYTYCVPSGTPVGCANNLLNTSCTFGVGACQQAGTYTCDTSLASPMVACTPNSGVPIAPQAEICDNIDNNCNGDVDSPTTDGVVCQGVTCFPDTDGDGFGTGAGTNLPNVTTCPAGQASQGGDCNDANAAVKPGAAEICDVGTQVDNDCDGTVNENVVCNSVTCFADADGDGYGYGAPTTYQAVACPANTVGIPGDCNDTVATGAAFHPGATEICNNLDDNCDGQIDGGNTCQSVRCFPDVDGDSFGSGAGVIRTGTFCNPFEVKIGGDCDDSLATGAAIHPGATEVCDAVDNDCDTVINGGLVCMSITCYPDGDADGFGTGTGTTMPLAACPANFAASTGDCNDASALVHPGALELCNTVDDDCSGAPDDLLVCTSITCFVDADNDGHGAGAGVTTPAVTTCPSGQVGLNDDCNDAVSSIHPGAAETCNMPTPIDDDCDGTINDGLSCAVIACYTDTDGDTYGAGAAVIRNQATCNAGEVTQGGDCNNVNVNIHPNATEVCGNAIDDDCDGVVDDGCVMLSCFIDGDNDGYGNATGGSIAAFGSCPAGRVANSNDCNDAAPAISPAATEVCDAVDNNCNGQTNEGLTCTSVTCYTDSDADTFGAGGGASYPGMTCPAGTVSNNTDCNDGQNAVHPGAAELCDNVDNNCSGTVDEGCATTQCFADTDADGYGAGAATVITTGVCAVGMVPNNTDCQPALASSHPGAAEICGDAIDNNCNGTVNEGCATGTTTVTATLAAGHTYVTTGTSYDGVTCPAAPIVINPSDLNQAAGSSCSISGGNVATCTTPTGVSWAIRACVNFGGTVYIMHTAYLNPATNACQIATQAPYIDYSSVTIANGMPFACAASGIRNAAL
ncbi:MAG: putative metal-binding motif-containing protein [Patescibacteria group bacterium]